MMPNERLGGVYQDGGSHYSGDDCQVTPVIHVLQYPGCVPKPIPSFACIGRCASYIQVSGSKIWQMERSCMCCQESGEREASVSLFCPKAKNGEKKFRKTRQTNNDPSTAPEAGSNATGAGNDQQQYSHRPESTSGHSGRSSSRSPIDPYRQDSINQPPSDSSSLDGNVFADGANVPLHSKQRRSQTTDSLTSGNNISYSLNKRFISKNQMKEFREAFRLFDKDNDGSITKEELGTVMRSLGQFARVEELQEMLLEIDVDGDGNVSFEEFVDIMSNMTDTVAETSADQEERELRDAFRVFDKHNRGYITASDLRAVLQCLGEDLDEEEIEDMIKEVDVDGDGRIDFYEFVHALGEPEDSQENDEDDEIVSQRSPSFDVQV
ncbi:calcium-binding protein 4-like [Anopheles marshallii]|uniref:calcium-binding protein 4-like n=1 Tax=Anopheles marshallii TaxID=1521116 RepID=UPI00237AC020|nr:calcium-binding protein 4-like [Anopheles marshallii]